MNINWNLVALIVGFAFYGFLAWLATKRLVSSGFRQIRKLPRAIQAIFLIVAIIATVEAQKANTNGNNNASGGTNGLFNAGGPSTFPNHGPLVPQQNGMAAMMQHSALLQRFQQGLPSSCVLSQIFAAIARFSELPKARETLGSIHRLIHAPSYVPMQNKRF